MGLGSVYRCTQAWRNMTLEFIEQPSICGSGLGGVDNSMSKLFPVAAMQLMVVP